MCEGGTWILQDSLRSLGCIKNIVLFVFNGFKIFVSIVKPQMVERYMEWRKNSYLKIWLDRTLQKAPFVVLISFHICLVSMRGETLISLSEMMSWDFEWVNFIFQSSKQEEFYSDGIGFNLFPLF